MTDQIAPDSLGWAGTKLWNDITSEWTLRVDEQVLLLEACRLKDELERLSEEMENVPVLVPGAKGQERVHPLYTEVRSHRLAIKQILSALALGGSDASDPEARSAHGRALARARWGNRGAA